MVTRSFTSGGHGAMVETPGQTGFWVVDSKGEQAVLNIFQRQNELYFDFLMLLRPRPFWILFSSFPLFPGPCRRPRLLAGLRRRGSAGHGPLCCRTPSTRVLRSLGGQEWRSDLPLLFCATDRREPLNRAL